jgi:molybdopterin/thiamine biosynthesis adenylyltransferase
MAPLWFLTRKNPANRPLAKQKVVIVGLGGIGSAAAHLMDELGVGHLILIDDDTVELDNLQRQILYDEGDLGESKVLAAQKRLSHARAVIHRERLTERNLHLLRSDLVLDCTDNLETRYLINRHCIEAGIPWVYCTVAGDHGFVKLITQTNGCLQCFYKRGTAGESSRDVGILNTAVQMAASVQARLALSFLSGKSPENALISFDVWHARISRIMVRKDPHCPVCGAKVPGQPHPETMISQGGREDAL